MQNEILEQLDKVIEYYNDMQSDSPDNLSLPNFHNAMAVLIDLREISNQVERVVIPKIAKAIKEIVWMARRYADGRQTFSASSFNDAYDVLRDVFGEEIEFTKYKDLTLTEDGAFFPYAQDGGDRKYFDAVRDRKYSNFSV